MATFNPTIFQDISGSVGNVTTYKLGDKHVARAKAFEVKDAKTPAQLKQRTRVSVITKLRRSFNAALEIGYCSSSKKVCLNCFMKDNVGKVEVDDDMNVTLDLLSLSLSGGELDIPRVGAEIEANERQVRFRWERQPLMPRAAKDDRLFGVVYERVLQRSRLVELGTRGESGELAWMLPEEWDAGQLVVYGFAASANGRKASGTLGILG
ncbi:MULTISPECIES: DUF6266 family protein [Butyricimonas]|uniref:DUF6266 family protein n=1 Tax=Butyricimonas TaxID=574697 RepID=UPI001D064005|nr:MULTISPECIES: DUF6266 family protein [Butyricimonas]MCB6971136.1 DUF6266 family protein [Butyricimonas synergistica]MCG4517850.1 DUF6266 family protein [Butyricimonas sp. DFI.6.44]